MVVLVQPTLPNDVYHYTNADVGIYNIVAQGALRLGPYESTNDPQESQRKLPSLSSHASIDSSEDWVSQIWEQADLWLRRYVKLACFTQDFELPDNAIERDALRGWGHMSLWAHYAARHSGVCLRFDRPKLIEAFHDQLGSLGQCFHGAVQYPVQRFSAVPTESLDVGQVLEFGVDAVVSQYLQKHHQELFFTKHHDWASESEFRLVLNEASRLPVYLKTHDCLTGVLLGYAFPTARLDAVRSLQEQMPHVNFVQLHYQNGRFFHMPIDHSTERLTIVPRRPGSLPERLQTLQAAEAKAAHAKARAADLTSGIASTIAQAFSEIRVACAAWRDAGAASYPRIFAVPPENRARMPGVPENRVEFETGWMCVVDSLPKRSHTLIIALAFQVLEGEELAVHALIQFETQKPDGSRDKTSELWRICHDSTLRDADTIIRATLEEIDLALQTAKAEFDSARFE